MRPRVNTPPDARPGSWCSGAPVVVSVVDSATGSSTRKLAASCAVHGGSLAAALGASVSHVASLLGAWPLTTRGMAEGGTWFQEGNCRKCGAQAWGFRLPEILESTATKTKTASPSTTSQRPQVRRQVREAVQVALSQHATTASASGDAENVIHLLQHSLQNMLTRAHWHRLQKRLFKH